MRQILLKFLDLVFPDQCIGCGKVSVLLCPVCKTKIGKTDTCEQSFVTSIFSYRDPLMKRLVWLLKYKNAVRVAEIFAPDIAQGILEFVGEEKMFLGESPILLVPVPLSKKRKSKRGYNQSEILAKEVQMYCEKNFNSKNIRVETKLVVKIKDTLPQAQIKKRMERILNPHGSFEIVPNTFSKKEIIILIDDVTTTGATLSCIRTLLKQDGFRKIYAFTIAH